MKILYFFTISIFLFNAAQVNAESPSELESCIEELEEVRENIQKIDKDAIEVVDGYQDPALFETIIECESAKAEAYGVFDKIKNCQKQSSSVPSQILNLQESLIEKAPFSEKKISYIENKSIYKTCMRGGDEVNLSRVEIEPESNGPSSTDEASRHRATAE